MGIFDKILGAVKDIAQGTTGNSLGRAVNRGISRGINGTVNSAVSHSVNGAINKLNNKSKTVTIDKLPQSVEELVAMPQNRRDEFEVAALCVAVLCNYENNAEETFKMLDYLRGPRPLTPSEKQFINERLSGKPYKMLSFFNGSSPENDYTPAQPLTITVKSNPYSYDCDGYATLHLKSSGADDTRPMKLRKKPSTGEWFVWDIFIWSDIRIPASQDQWR